MKADIVFTGGGTAGHVTPNLALIDALPDHKVAYIGSHHGIEHQMLKAKQVPYYAVRSGKLRRYFSWKNFIDPFNLLIGIVQSFFILRQLKPAVVFSKGGFVALPVVIGAWVQGIPVIAHESDLSPGLANRLSFPFVSKICVTFEKGRQYFKKTQKVLVTGTPLRPELFQGNRDAGFELTGFDKHKPCILVMGGSLGSNILNTCLREALPNLCEKFQVVHLCGQGKLDERYKQAGYFQLEYASDELPDLLAMSDLVLSRAGANALYELLALNKSHVLVPLSKRYSRGDQIANAEYFEKEGASIVIAEEELTASGLCQTLEALYQARSIYQARIEALNIQSATETLISLLKGVLYSK